MPTFNKTQLKIFRFTQKQLSAQHVYITKFEPDFAPQLLCENFLGTVNIYVNINKYRIHLCKWYPQEYS
jgi:hypothetical protein